MKSVLISIRPKWCEKIMNGEKTVEIRKTVPRTDKPFRVFIYCTRGNPKEAESVTGNGKVIAEFVCDKADKIPMAYGAMVNAEDCERACMTSKEMLRYANHKALYGWNITELTIYNEPKELNDFGVKHAPQSWCYCSEKFENGR